MTKRPTTDSSASNSREPSALADRQRARTLPRGELTCWQLERLNQLLAAILPYNKFYSEKLSDVSLPLTSLDQLTQFPTTTKEEWIAAAESSPPSNLTYPLTDYCRLHRTSGTHGAPLVVFDTASDWEWWIETWQYVLDAAEVTSADRALMAFSFGPFIGFWSAYDALADRHAMVIPTGGLTTEARVRLIGEVESTVICCTPTYALRMAETARELNVDLAGSSVRTLVVAGEPGGSLPAVRSRIERAWGATVIDHSGATEVGPWGYGDASGNGLYVIESEFIAEFVPAAKDDPAAKDETTTSENHELVLTALGRTGWPVIRYRTGDLVQPLMPANGQGFVRLDGGILGRSDEMVVVRGMNVFPSAIEEILRGIAEIDEFRIVVYREREMDALRVEVEDGANQPERIATALHEGLGLRVEVVICEPGSLPRFQAKSRRLQDQRKR